MKQLATWLIWTYFTKCCHCIIVLPSFIADGMVLQQEPQKAQIWGSTDDTKSAMKVTLKCVKGYSGSFEAILDGMNFTATMGPVPQGENCEITILQGSASLSLKDVLFGDVFVCSGQSNMETPMNFITNTTEEKERSYNYTNIRMYILRHMASENEQDDLMRPPGFKSWGDASNHKLLGQFSAICFLFARYISQRLPDKTFGLIHTACRATYIESWSPSESLDSCLIPEIPDPRPKMQKSQLYNAMIHPFVRFSIKGVLWYQGEANVDFNRGGYSCTFPALIRGWRKRWSDYSPTPNNFPFGFVQLAADKADGNSYGTSIIRWKQTFDRGIVPNDKITNGFMAVALDTFDSFRTIHPRYKQIVGERLAIAGLNVVYGKSEYPTSGPFWTSIAVKKEGGSTVATINYDKTFDYNSSENTGFYYCLLVNTHVCDDTPGSWQLVAQDKVVQVSPNTMNVTIHKQSSGLGYLYKESPILRLMATPIYTNDEFRLPCPPWKVDMNIIEDGMAITRQMYNKICDEDTEKTGLRRQHTDNAALTVKSRMKQSVQDPRHILDATRAPQSKTTTIYEALFANQTRMSTALHILISMYVMVTLSAFLVIVCRNYPRKGFGTWMLRTASDVAFTVLIFPLTFGRKLIETS